MIMDIVKWLSNVKYQPEGQILVNDHPELGVFKIAEIRGWSYMQSTFGMDDAVIFMDQVGAFIQEAIHEKLQGTKLVEKLLIEIDELSEKIERLSVFHESDAFHKINPKQIELLTVQLSSMNNYLLCLQLRIKPGNGIVPLPDANQE